MALQHWLVKSEPNKYAYEQLEKDGRTVWDGVRNFEARNNLRSMKKGDLLLFYHSNIGKEVVGVAKVLREAYPDPTAKGEDWSVVEIGPVAKLKVRIALDAMKSDAKLTELALIKRGRLSVVPVTPEQFDHILGLAKTKLPRA